MFSIDWSYEKSIFLQIHKKIRNLLQINDNLTTNNGAVTSGHVSYYLTSKIIIIAA